MQSESGDKDIVKLRTQARDVLVSASQDGNLQSALKNAWATVKPPQQAEKPAQALVAEPSVPPWP
jgi:hypothetical protein